jgi:hypothetical protein
MAWSLWPSTFVNLPSPSSHSGDLSEHQVAKQLWRTLGQPSHGLWPRLHPAAGLQTNHRSWQADTIHMGKISLKDTGTKGVRKKSKLAEVPRTTVPIQRALCRAILRMPHWEEGVSSCKKFWYPNYFQNFLGSVIFSANPLRRPEAKGFPTCSIPQVKSASSLIFSRVPPIHTTTSKK